jgi:prophage DNA circulation protein
MSWRDRYQPASYRGVPFFVQNAELEAGRRKVVHKFALKALPYVEDLGKEARSFTLNGYVLGPDYDLGRNALLEAIEKEGAGTLVHPYYGTLTVSLTEPVKITESAEEGGMARFSFTFIEAAEDQFPTAVTDQAAKLSASGRFLKSVASADLVATMIVNKVPQYVRDASSGELSKLATLLGDMVFPGVSGTVLASFNRLLTALDGDKAILSTQPAQLASRVQEVISSISDIAATPEQAAINLQPLIQFSPAAGSNTTATQQAAQGNRQAVADLIARSAMAEAAAAVQNTSYPTYEDAVASRDQLAAAIDRQADTASDAVYPALVDLRADLVAAVPGEDETLPHIATVVLGQTMPSLVVGYDLYDAPGRGAEVVSRNRVRHPGFVPGGRGLMVLDG